MICRPDLKHSDHRTLNFKFAIGYKFAQRINKPNQCLFAMKGRCFFNGYTIMTLVFTTLMTKHRIKITWCKNKNTLSTAALIRSRKFLLQGKIFNCFLLSWWILFVIDFRMVGLSAIILVAEEIWNLAPKITSWFQNLGAKMDAWIQNYGAKNNSWSRSDEEDLNQLVCFTFFLFRRSVRPQDLARVHDALGVEGLLDGPHHVDGHGSVHLFEKDNLAWKLQITLLPRFLSRKAENCDTSE